MLVSIENLHSINETYGIKNGDLVLKRTVREITKFLYSKGIYNFPLGHIKGGDFLIGLDESKDEYLPVMDLMCLKFSSFLINNIEVQIVGSIIDNHFSKNLDYMIDYLFEQQSLKKSSKEIIKDEDIIDPNDLEMSIIDAIRNSSFKIYSQSVYDKNGNVFLDDLSAKLMIKDKVVHQKVFIPVVNRLGLAKEYDLMLLDEVAKKISADDNICSFSISPTTVREAHFLSYMKGLMDSYPAIRNRVVFLLSEIDYYNNITRYNQTIQSLRRMGISIAIDRFGEYHSSSLYFREIEVDMVRFDSRYTKNLKSERYKKVLKGLHESVNSLNSKSWIKMVEDEETYEIAKDIGIDIIQGKYLDNLKEK